MEPKNKSMNNKVTIICLTPVKNEAWILDKFLKSASLWADYIIIADQNSTDGSIEIAKKYPKVILVENNSAEFNENQRQKLLINEARKIGGPKILIALDADEFFTANFQESTEWQMILNSKPGDAFYIKWLNIYSNRKFGWFQESSHVFAIFDDDSPHIGSYIHSERLPVSKNSNKIIITSIFILHLQYIFWKRMESKQRYYQCLEVIKYPEKHPIDIYRKYNHMYAIPKSIRVTLNKKFFSIYLQNGIDILEKPKGKYFWFDREVLEFFMKYSTKNFSKLGIWGVNWSKRAYKFGYNPISDPRTLLDKIVHIWLKLTQKYKDTYFVTRIEKTIRYRFKW